MHWLPFVFFSSFELENWTTDISRKEELQGCYLVDSSIRLIFKVFWIHLITDLFELDSCLARELFQIFRCWPFYISIFYSILTNHCKFNHLRIEAYLQRWANHWHLDLQRILFLHSKYEIHCFLFFHVMYYFLILLKLQKSFICLLSLNLSLPPVFLIFLLLRLFLRRLQYFCSNSFFLHLGSLVHSFDFI